MKYACDFETTTNPEDCRVWAWGAREVDKGDEFTGIDIDSFMEWCCEHKDSTMYFHNLKFDGGFIVDWLLKNGFQWTMQRSLMENQFNTLVTDMGQWYFVKIRFTDRHGIPIKVEIYDSLKFIPMSIEDIPGAYGLEEHKLTLDYNKERPKGYRMDEAEKEYLLADIRILAKAIKIMHDNGQKKMTTAANALSSFRTIYGKRYKFDFPTLDRQTDADIRKTYKGGFTYLNPVYQEVMIGEGVVYDVNSMYPWAMKFCKLPYGAPIFFTGEYKPSKIYDLFTICIRCSFKIKPNRIPSIQIKKSWRFNETEYLTNSDGEVILNLTSVDYKLFLHNYEVKIYEVYGGYMFKSTVGIFKDYVDNWYAMKDKSRTNGDKGMERIAKLMLNSLYGKFGSSKDRKQKMPYLNEEGKVCFKLLESDEAKGGYLPIASFITSYCRDKIIRAAEVCGDRFIYADTDSLHVKGTDPIPGLDIDSHRLGAFKEEERFIRAKFIRQKTYLEVYMKDGEEHMNIKAAGMPKKAKELVTEENFTVGAEFGGKLVPRIVPGGVILRETTFSIKKAKVATPIENKIENT